MKIERKSDTLVEIKDGAIRIESGPVRRREKATEELLGERTADHYREGGVDALGKPIALGKPMDYIDWKSAERVWTVYAKDKDSVYQPVGEPHATYESALSAATEI